MMVKVPFTKGHVRIDTSFRLDNLAILGLLLSMLVGGVKFGAQVVTTWTAWGDTVKEFGTTLVDAVKQEHEDVTTLSRQEQESSAELQQQIEHLSLRVEQYGYQLTEEQYAIRVLQQDVRVFAKSLGAPLPTNVPADLPPPPAPPPHRNNSLSGQ